MKLYAYFLSWLLLSLITSCKQDESVDPLANCRLTGWDYTPNGRHRFEYDVAGNVTRMTRAFEEGVPFLFDYKLTYDAAGRLSRSEYKNTIDGQVTEGTETYTWTGNRITRLDYQTKAGEKGFNQIKYSPSGQMLEFTYEGNADPDQNAKKVFEYDAKGILVKLSFANLAGDVFFQRRLLYSGNVIKTAWSLLPNAGVPIDVVIGQDWEPLFPDNNANAAFEFYEADPDGKLALYETSKLSNIKTNAQGVMVGWTDPGTTTTFSVVGCP
ncbi:MAG: hypothetical protein LH606_11980 [Cytophagaceae bacterium]|nr:hypothetical protein [Cytophagaceae bacterium]